MLELWKKPVFAITDIRRLLQHVSNRFRGGGNDLADAAETKQRHQAVDEEGRFEIHPHFVHQLLIPRGEPIPT